MSELQELIQRLKESKARTLAYFDLPKEQLHYNYGEGKWNIKQLLHHITDAETVLYERIRRTIVNPGQHIKNFAQDQWNEVLDYQNVPLSLNRNVYAAVREMAIYYIELHFEDKAENTFVHNLAGQKSLKELCLKNAWHNEKHLEHIQLALSLNEKSDNQ